MTEQHGAPAADGAVFVLVHGIGVSSRYFERLVPLLAEHGVVHVLDLPGFGSAPKPTSALTIADIADLVGAYIEHSEPEAPVVVIGHSMGSQVATELAVTRPDLVAGAVLVSAVVDPAAPTVLGQGKRLFADILIEPAIANFIVLTDYLRCGMRWYLTELPMMLRYDTLERIRGARVPVLVVRGRRDPVAPTDWSLRLAAAAPDGRTVVVPGAAHIVQLSRPRRLATPIVSFARRCAKRSTP